MRLNQHDQYAVSEPRQTVVMSGHGLDQEIARLVTEERLLRFLHTPIQFGGAAHPTADSASALDFLPGSTRRDIARDYSLPCGARLSKLDKRVGDTRQGFGALGSVDVLHDPIIFDEVVKCPSKQLTENFSQ
jgi:hypothetical protein